ncbi:MAG: ABC transporter permease [Bdellovibrionales bacterium]|nr:ABC transporter permease [Bdellovibrionales bacterium]
MVIKTFDKKLLRDLSSLKAQVFSIALVVGLGVAVLFGFSTTHKSLLKSRDDFYKSHNFADLFLNVKKAPFYAAEELQDISGVALIETRLEYDALLSVPKMIEPAVGHFVSIPDGKQPLMNQIFVKLGRLPSPFASEEVVVSEGFFKFHKLNLGDHFWGTLNGRQKKFRIVGVGVTPEHIIAIQSGSPFPDDQHFTLIWTNQSVLEASYDMRGSFNSAIIKTKAGVNKEALIHAIDQRLDKYGGFGAFGRDKQVSSVYVSEELKQLKVHATFIPVIFFLVAAFILNVVISRMVRSQRPQIATFKAIGYHNKDILSYYFKVGSLIVLIGALIGILLGLWIGDSMLKLYADFYHFPTLSYDFSFLQVGLAVAISLVTAAIGVFSSLRRLFRLQPAEAMRPPTPPIYHQSFFEKSHWFRLLSSRARMMIRGVSAFPLRALSTGIGLSFAVVLLIGGLFWQDSMKYLILAQYSFIQKETGSIQLIQSIESSVVYEVNRLSGVIQAEGYRLTAVKARFRNKEQNTVIKGMPPNPQLQGVINDRLEKIHLPDGGVYISRILARQLAAKEGDTIEIEVLEGKKPTFNLKVEKIVDSFMASEILTSRSVLAQLLREDDLVNRVLFRSYAGSSELYTKLKEMPQVLTVNFRDSALKVFNETSATFLLVFAFILSLFAGAIGFGIAYNNMRVTLAERDWEMATLEILGFTVPEVFRILVGEIFFLLALFIPVGWVMGYWNSLWLISAMSMDNFEIPFVINPVTFFMASVILLLSCLISAWLIYGRLKKLDLVATLKSRG